MSAPWPAAATACVAPATSSTWPCVSQILSTEMPARVMARSTFGKSPPGSITTARFVTVQFCWKGVTGTMQIAVWW
jgi:hypothetical protein